MRTIVLAVALGVALAACGGGGEGFKDPDRATFDYGAEQAPTAAESAAATRAATAVVGATGLPGEADTSSAPDDSFGEATSSLTTGETLPGGGVFASPDELAQATIARLDTTLLQEGLPVDWSQGCWTATPSKILFDACQLPIDDADPGKLSGSLALSGSFDLSAGLATWDATAEAHLGGDTPFRATGFEHLQGSLAWTDTTLSGQSRVDVSLNVFSYGLGDSGGRQSWHEWHDLWRGVTYATDYDLTFAAAGACASRVTGGTITVKRLWAAAPPFATGDAFTDASIRFTWSGCGDDSTHLTVARRWEAI